MQHTADGAPRRKLSDIFNKDEIEQLTTRSDAMGWRALLFTVAGGVIGLTFVALARWPQLRQDGRAWHDYLGDGARNMWRPLALYLVWIGAYMTTYSLFMRIRSMAEHACTEQGTDMLRARGLVAPPPGYLDLLRIVSARAPSAG